MQNQIIGSGLVFPPRFAPQGGLALITGVEELEQAIDIILMTSPGQRVMRPTFGSRLHELIFAPNNLETAVQATTYVKEALSMWEPRIKLLDVQARSDTQHDGRLLIDIQYEIKATHDRRSLVYPFYLIPEE